MENKATGMSTVLMRWAPGARLPHHEHVAIEQTFVLEGSFADHDGVCRAGNYVWRSAGSRHDASTAEGCLVLAFFLKPNTFFDCAAGETALMLRRPRSGRLEAWSTTRLRPALRDATC